MLLEFTSEKGQRAYHPKTFDSNNKYQDITSIVNNVNKYDCNDNINVKC